MTKRNKLHEEQWGLNLREYLRDDVAYQKYLKEKDFKPNEFDKYCIDHCLDIQEALDEISSLRTNYSKLKSRKRSEGVIIDGE